MRGDKAVFIFSLAVIFLLSLILVHALTSVTIISPQSGQNLSGIILLNATTNNESAVNATFSWINANGDYVLNVTVFNDSTGVFFVNNSFNTALLADGVYNLTVNATNSTGESVLNMSTQGIMIDNSAPSITDASHIFGPLGFGVVNDSDGFFSTASGNNIINLTINVSDPFSTVKNVTLNMSSMCSSASSVAASQNGTLWTANCTVNLQGNFNQKNITIVACDYAGNCNNSLYRTVTLYNFTVPPNVTGLIEFDSSLTTSLASQADLQRVNYLIGIRLNGSTLPSQPWSGMQLTAVLNFSSINFTNSQVQQDLQNLQTAINITVAAPRSYNSTRLFVNSTAFAALNTNTTVTLYNVPFTSFSSDYIANDTGGNGGIVFQSFLSNGDNTGNLTFSVGGFSGYNITDNSTPTTAINSPANHSILNNSVNFIFNATFNGTGTEINNASINLTLTNLTGSTFYYSYSNMSCDQSGERLTCAVTPLLADGTYNFSVYVEDYGGLAGNSLTTLGSNITLNDTIAPNITSVSSGGISSSAATITWTTNERSNSSVNYGTATSLGTLTGSSSMVTSHSVSLAGLSASTLYFFNVTSCDLKANCNSSGPNNFTTSAAATSGGGGGSSSTILTTKTDKTLNNVGDSRQFDFKSEESKLILSELPRGLGSHSVKLKSWNSATKEATIEVASTPKIVVLKEGQSEKFDLDEDGYYDLQVSVDSVLSTGVKSTIKVLDGTEAVLTSAAVAPSEEVVSEEEEVELILPEKAEESIEESKDSAVVPVVEEVSGKLNAGMLALILIVIVIVLSLVYYFFFMKKK